MAFDPKGLTPAYLRTARALLNWSAERLAQQADVGVVTVRRAETVKGFIEKMQPETAEKIVRALEKAGVRFLEKGRDGGAGVRLSR